MVVNAGAFPPKRNVIEIFFIKSLIFLQVKNGQAYSVEPWSLHDLTSPIFLRYFDRPTTWVDAEATCRKHFGHLVRGKIY